MINGRAKKILFLVTDHAVGGAQKYVADLARNLDEKEYEAKIVAGGKDIKYLSNRVRPYFFFMNDLMAVHQLISLFRRERPDIIHLNSSKAGVVGTCAAALYNQFFRGHRGRARVIFTAHGWVFNPINAISPMSRAFYVVLHRFAACYQDIIINVSEFDRSLGIRMSIAPPGKLVTIRNGIDYENLNFLDKVSARREILRRLGISDDTLLKKSWIGSIGRLVKEKNYETLVRAAAALPDASFFIIGEGYEAPALTLLIKEHRLERRFFIVPPTGNDAPSLPAFDAFVLASVKEGFPYTVLEAMGAGLPIVATSVGGIPEAIEHGVSGLLVFPRESPLLAETLSSLLSDLGNASRLGQAAQKRAYHEFTLARMARETIALYDAVTNL